MIKTDAELIAEQLQNPNIVLRIHDYIVNSFTILYDHIFYSNTIVVSGNFGHTIR